MEISDRPSRLKKSVLDQESLLHRITNRIRQSLELEEILAATVAEVRLFLQTDRVMVYQFGGDGSGEIIAESINEGRLSSFLGLRFPPEDIPQEAREMFLLARQRSVVDVDNGRIGLSPLLSKDTGENIGVESIRYRTVDPCHVQYLKAMGVKSSLVVPILDYEQQENNSLPRLWGLLISHHSESRTVLKRELKVAQQVVDQVSIAIAQSCLLTQARAEKQREEAINQIITLLHCLPTMQLQAALENTTALLNAAGGRLYIYSTGELYSCGNQPTNQTIAPGGHENNILELNPVWRSYVETKFRYKQEKSEVLEISDIYKEKSLRVLAPIFNDTHIRGMLIIPLNHRSSLMGVLTIFRNEFDTETLWAGKKDKNQQQSVGSLSFEVWREFKRAQAPEWKVEDISIAKTLCHHFSMAIQQQLMLQQVTSLNATLEQQVQQQTAELEKSLLLAKVIKQVTQQIRSTLDYKTTLLTIVREVRTLLNTDRVLIYQLEDNRHGEVVVEEINGNWQSVLGIKTPQECLPEDYTKPIFRPQVKAVASVSAASLSICHQEFLFSLQVQAYLTVPIQMGDKLWGLLIAHQCHAPRNWLDAEIELVQQLAGQATIAIAQAQLYEQSRNAEITAKQALRELQEAQTQLIQSEKMSSLGQLVAGIAHEINNPVNFIYGNLSHALGYTQDLLDLLNLYMAHYPQPDKEIKVKADSVDIDFLMEDLPKIMSSMQVGAERIRSIVLSLRNFSRLDEAQMKPVDLHEGIDNTLLILQHRLKRYSDFPGIEIIKNYEKLPLVECYAGQLNQVFMNILSNAIDALEMNKGKWGWESGDIDIFTPLTIRIDTTKNEEKNSIFIRFADNGPGMTEEVKKKMFDPFFTTKPVGKGTGLGLAISYQIIQKHSGVMDCISEPGKGTEFWIEIPMYQSGGDIDES